MPSKEVLKVCKDIKSLKIQGARNVAKAAVHALALQARSSKAKTSSEFRSELLEAADALSSTRPTEPMLRNSLRKALRFVFFCIYSGKKESVADLKKRMAAEEKEYSLNMDKNSEKIAEIGAKLIPKGSVVLTHCHSSTVTKTLKRAYEMGRLSRVICTETRPLFQGRITAKELSEAGIPVTLIVDSAVKSAISEFKPSLVLVGSDAISASGELINKIGTSVIAEIASAHDVPLYCAAEIYKFDPATIWGKIEEIELRSESEVLGGIKRSGKAAIGSFFGEVILKGVSSFNPAFDRTEPRFITSYITELGVFPPQSLAGILQKEFGIKNPM